MDVSKLESLPALVLATQFAASEAERVAPSEKTVRQKLSQAAGLRRKVLSALEVLAAHEFIAHKEVEPILEGRGPMDMAKDCVAGVALLRKYENEIGGRNPATTETMSEVELLRLPFNIGFRGEEPMTLEYCDHLNLLLANPVHDSVRPYAHLAEILPTELRHDTTRIGQQ